MTDSVDEHRTRCSNASQSLSLLPRTRCSSASQSSSLLPRTRCSKASQSSSLLRSARRLSHHHSQRVIVSTDLSIDPARRESSPLFTWQHRRQGADCCRNGRPTTSSAVVERIRDTSADGRQPGTAPSRADDDGGVAAAGFSPTLVTDVREVRRLMTGLQSRIAAKDALEVVARDWRLVATCLDRTLFWFYCVVVAISLAAYFPRSEE